MTTKQMLFVALNYIFIAILLGLGYYYEALPIQPEVWDNVANIGWAMVPCTGAWVLAAFALNIREFRVAKVKVMESEAELNLAAAGDLDASMWQKRHATKRDNNFHRKQ